MKDLIIMRINTLELCVIHFKKIDLKYTCKSTDLVLRFISKVIIESSHINSFFFAKEGKSFPLFPF